MEITGPERDALLEAGLIRHCRECAVYHFRRAREWNDIDAALRLLAARQAEVA